MSYFVYVLSARINNKLITYVGYTNNLKKRLYLHNTNKGAKFTKGKRWKLIYFEKYKTKSKAMKREYYIKTNKKLRSFIKKKIK